MSAASELILVLLAENERLRKALQRIYNGSLGNFSAAMIAKDALAAVPEERE